MINLFTENLFWQKRLKNRIKKLLGKTGGPEMVEKSLFSGLKELSTEFSVNADLPADSVCVLSGIETLKWAIRAKRQGKIKSIVAGPNIVITPNDAGEVLKSPEIDKIIVPSEWVKDFYLSLAPELSSKIFVWAAGVELPQTIKSDKISGAIILNKVKGDMSLFDKIESYLEEKKILLVIVLDEIDQLVNKIGDEILYNLTRLNSELNKSEISLVGISNDLVFADNLDPRVKSSLSEEEIVFSPYNAVQLQKILKERAELAFKEKVLGEGVIEKCAAYAAKEHGDARRALELLRIAGELAERNNKNFVTLEFVDLAEEKVERDRVVDTVISQPKQVKLTLYSIFEMSLKANKCIFTGDIYDLYKDICFKTGERPLTQRRISDVIAELEMLGIINAKVISKGRYGRTREICLAIPNSLAAKININLKENLNL